MRKIFLLAALASLAIAGTAIGSSVAGAASSGSSASGASASGDDQATAARRRGRRGPRGRRGARGPSGPAGAVGPAGPAGGTGGGGTGGAGGVVPFEFRGNTGAPIQQLFVANGLAIEVDCSNGNVARLRSSAADGFAMSSFAPRPTEMFTPPEDGDDADGVIESDDVEAITGLLIDTDTDFDFNNLVMLTTPPGAVAGLQPPPRIYQGTFAHTTNFALSNVVTGVYLASINLNTSAGNCVVVGTTQRD